MRNFNVIIFSYLICVVHAESDSTTIFKGVYKVSLRLSAICWSVDQLHLTRTREDDVSGPILWGERGSVCLCALGELGGGGRGGQTSMLTF